MLVKSCRSSPDYAVPYYGRGQRGKIKVTRRETIKGIMVISERLRDGKQESRPNRWNMAVGVSTQIKGKDKGMRERGS